MISRSDIAWAAGFLEGEGCFYLNKRFPVISASQVNREPLDKLQKMFGGSIYRHYYPALNVFKSKPIHRWMVGKEARGVMMTLWTDMSKVRRSKIKNALIVWRQGREWKRKKCTQ